MASECFAHLLFSSIAVAGYESCVKRQPVLKSIPCKAPVMGAARVFRVNGYCMKSITLIYFIVFHLEDVIFHFQDDRTQNPSDLNLQITDVSGRKRCPYRASVVQR